MKQKIGCLLKNNKNIFNKITKEMSLNEIYLHETKKGFINLSFLKNKKIFGETSMKKYGLSGNDLYLEMILTKKGTTGGGNELLNFLINYSKIINKNILLTPIVQEKGRISQKQLKNWYIRNGFEKLKGLDFTIFIYKKGK